jgi:galactose mutarotase-like enzyme
VLVARFDFAADEELMAAFPFPHELLFEAILAGATLTVVTTVVASGNTGVPISFGYHPYLRLVEAGPDLPVLAPVEQYRATFSIRVIDVPQ